MLQAQRRWPVNIIPLALLVALNFGISWFNAWSVGRSWADSRAIGGSLRTLAGAAA